MKTANANAHCYSTWSNDVLHPFDIFLPFLCLNALVVPLSVVRSGDYYLFETDSEEEEEEDGEKEEEVPKKSAFQVSNPASHLKTE